MKMTRHLITPKGDITIQFAGPDQAPALFKLRLEALTQDPVAFAADIEMTQTRGVEAWADQISREEKEQSGVIVTATRQNDLIGMSGIGRGHWPKTRHIGIVWGVYVSADWRGLGIAAAILDECFGWAHEHGIVVLKLGVLTTNEAAIHLYQQLGFTIYGTDPKSNFYQGVYYDEYLMVKTI